MNGNEKRAELQATEPGIPTGKTEITDEKLEDVSGETPDYTIDDGNGCCYWCHEPLVTGLRSGVLFCKRCKLYTRRS